MNISYNWLRELIDIALAPRELAERLTMIGLAVDAVHEAGADHVLEIDLTSNRPDCLSHLGVAREVAVIEDKRLHFTETNLETTSGRTENFTSVEIQDRELCPRYAARIVRGVKIAPSPAWLSDRLLALGQRPINNVADITNYVLLELGQPLHAFDLSKLAEQRIVVRRAREAETLVTLDGVERKLDGEMLVIADAARAVAVAGVMGGQETAVSDTTRDVLIESAYFDPASVRRTAQTLGLHTDASYHFERGVDYEGTLRAQERAAALICEIAGGTASEDAIDVYPQRIEPPTVGLRFERVEALTGLKVEAPRIVHILGALGFAPYHEIIQSEEDPEKRLKLFAALLGAEKRAAAIGDQGSSIKLTAPTWRVDIEREEDLIEEVARHVGYEHVAAELPASTVAGEYRAHEGRRRAARRALTACGYDEAVSFSFIDAAHDERFEVIPGLTGSEKGIGEEHHLVVLSNPIIEGATRMRPTLLPGLLDAVRHNFNHNTRNVQLFEMGRVFAANAEAGRLPKELESLALVATGSAIEEGRAGGARELDFYDLKGALETATDAMNVPSLEYEAASVRHLREGQAARVIAGGRFVGTLGRLAEEIAVLYKFRQPVLVAEVGLSLLLELEETHVRYAPLARYPSVVRDISLVAERCVSFAEMRRVILDLRVDNCRGVTLVDVYEGTNMPAGKRSITLRVEYRSDERTLRDEEVDEIHGRIVNTLEQTFGAQLRQ